jgi:hypothetical protein
MLEIEQTNQQDVPETVTWEESGDRATGYTLTTIRHTLSRLATAGPSAHTE